MEDVSGNQIIITYMPGAGMPWSGQHDTSARIGVIQDTRAAGYSGPICSGLLALPVYCSTTYQLTYNTDSPVPHLTGVTNQIGTAEAYTLTYSAGSLQPPFGYDPNYAGVTASFLAGMTPPISNPYQFTYDTAGAGELNQVTFPFGGHLRWSYANDTYIGSRSLRAVSGRFLAADSAGATEWSYGITRDSASSAVLHATMSLTDASGVGSKTWNFLTAAGTPTWHLGLVGQFLQQPSVSSSTILQSDTYVWSQDPAGRPYISQKTTVMDQGTANQQSALSTQTLDQYGNVTQSVIYPYNNTSTPLLTYNNTWLNSSTYTANYIFNRLVTSTLTTGGAVKTLAQNAYDLYGVDNPSGYQTPTGEIDANPLPFSHRGYLSSSTTPAGTTWTEYSAYGAATYAWRSDGTTVNISSTSATNYSAPQTITTQSYSTNIGYNAWLAPTQTTGSNGETMYISYDLGLPMEAISAYSTNGTPTITWWYSGLNVTPVWQQKTGPDGFTQTTLDGMGRAIKVQRGPSSSQIESEVDTVYAPCACSPLGKIQEVSQPYAPGTPSSQIAWTVYAYDGLGRTLSVVQPDGASTTTTAYSGNQTTVTDPAGNWKQFTKDALGNLIAVVEPDPANQPSGTLTTSYAYDWMNHVSQVTMTRGSTTQTRTFVYNDAGQITSATNPENGTVTYTYSTTSSPKPASKLDAKGQYTGYTYDTSWRVTEVQYYPNGKTNAEDTCQRVNYYWDSYPNDTTGFVQYAYGRLAARTYQGCFGYPYNLNGYTAFTEMYSYVPAGGVTDKRLQANVWDPNSPTGFDTYEMDAIYTFDQVGRTATLSYPGGAIYTSCSAPLLGYTYDAMGRMSGLTDECNGGHAAVVQSVQYDYAGRMTSLQQNLGPNGYGASTTEAMSYNQNNQMASLNWTNPIGPGGVGGGIAYSYSATQNNGQITQATDSISGETIGYQYDALKRLTSASSTPTSGSTTTPWTQTFQYDGFGNLTAKVLNGTTTTIGVNPATNQLSSAYYDANGKYDVGSGGIVHVR